MGGKRRPRRVGGERRQSGLVKHASLHRGALDHAALVALEPVEARRQQRLDRERHLVLRVAAVLGQHRGHLLDEEWVSLRRRHHPLALLRRQYGDPCQIVEQTATGLVRQPIEQDRGRVGLAAGPGRPRIQQLGPGGAHDQERTAAGPVCHVLDQVEQRRLGPVHVLEHQHRGPRAGDQLERPPHRPEHLLGRCRGTSQTDRTGDPVGQDHPVLVLRDQQLECFCGRCHGRLDSPIPATLRSISATGQNVIPSPYGRHCPTSTLASAAAPAASSATSRDLPTPAAPITVNR